MRFRFLLPCAFAVLSLACSKKETTDSADVTTHGMAMDYAVVSTDGTSANVRVTLHVGDYDSNQYVRLTNGDTLSLRTGGKTFNLQEHSQGQVGGGVLTYYDTTVPVGAGDFFVDFTRTNGASAINNKITLPAPYTLTAPTGTVSRKSPMTLGWDNVGVGYNIELDIHGDCIFDDFKTVVGEPGSIVVNGGELQPLSGHENDVCPVTITLNRRVKITESGGNFSSEFGHASQRDAQQARNVVFQSGP